MNNRTYLWYVPISQLYMLPLSNSSHYPSSLEFNKRSVCPQIMAHLNLWRLITVNHKLLINIVYSPWRSEALNHITAPLASACINLQRPIHVSTVLPWTPYISSYFPHFRLFCLHYLVVQETPQVKLNAAVSHLDVSSAEVGTESSKRQNWLMQHQT